MSPALIAPSPRRPSPFRWTGADFDQASQLGLFDGHHVELINGEILEGTPMNDPHANAVRVGTYLLIRMLPVDRYTVQVQLPLRLGESRPLPDFAVIAGAPGQIQTHPTEALLIVEISDTTIEFDQTEKAELYAANGIPEYWIADLNNRRFERRRGPARGPAGQFAYEECVLFGLGEVLECMTVPELRVAVAEWIR